MDVLLKILDELTNLTTGTDLFAYEIPLEKSGLWVADAQIESRFNDPGAQEFNCYYRGKGKENAIQNLKYLQNVIDGLSGSTGTCRLADGTHFNLLLLYKWDYLEKDSEGYFVWANRLRLVYDEPTIIPPEDIDGGNASTTSFSDTVDGGTSNSTFNDNIDGGNSNGN